MRKYICLLSFLGCAVLSIAQRHTHIRVLSKQNFTPSADSILQKALPLIDSVVNTPAFQQAVLTAIFTDNQGLSNEEILEMFLSGTESHRPRPNDTIDLVLETYLDQRGDNIGSTFNAKTIISSRAYMQQRGARCYAAHLIHEYCHTLGRITGQGFTHLHRIRGSKKRKRLKCQSVPYIIGDIARRLLGVTCNFECENYPQH
jgi:hypothetical protein